MINGISEINSKTLFFKSDNTHSQSHTLWLAIATANIIISVFLSRYYVIVRTIMESEKISKQIIKEANNVPSTAKY